MPTRQDIYAADSETCPHMLNKENYVPWSSHLLCYAKSRPNRKLIYNSIINGAYVRQMIHEPGDQNCKVPMNETFHEQTDDELTEKELKQVEANDQAIQTILFGLLEEIYAGVDSCETAHEIRLRVQQMMKGYDIGIQEKKEVDDLRAEQLATHNPLAFMAISNNPFNYLVFYLDQPSSSTYMKQPQPNNNPNPQPSFNQNYMQQPMPNPEDITDPTTTINMALVLMAKEFKLNYSTPTNNNQRILSNPRNRKIAQLDMNMVQEIQMQMVGGNGGNQFRKYVGQNNVRNQNGLIVVPKIANQNPNRNCNVVAARAEGNANGNYGIQLQAEEFDLMAATADLDEIEEDNANCILMANLQQASTSGTQIDKAPVYDSDGSVEVQLNDNCYNNYIFNMFTQEEQYTKLLEPIPESHQVPHNDSNVIYEVSSMEQDGETVKQHSVTVKETHAYFESLYNNLSIKVEKVNTVNRKLRETNDDLTTELARYKIQEKCFEISQEKYDKHERSNQSYSRLAKEADESLAKHKALELEIERLLRVVVSHDIMSIMQSNSVVDTSNLQTELEPYNNMQQKIEQLQAQLGDQKGKSKDTPCVSDTLDPLSQKLENENVELEFQGLSKIDETHALSKPVTLNSLPTQQESKVMKNENVIALGMFRIDPHKTSREDKCVPINKVRASVRTNPITVSQPHFITKKVFNSDSNGFSSTRVDITTETRRPRPRSNMKNHRNDKSEIVCAMCKQCLITASQDVFVLNYVNGMNSRGKKQKANASNTENQKKQKPKVKKPKKVESNERLASPKPSKTRSCLKWLPTGRIFNRKRKIIESNKSESHSDCLNDSRCSKHMKGNLKLLINFVWKLLGTVRFRNDVAVILGYGNLQWRYILITNVYFVEGLGHNLFLVGQFCDSNLEVSFRRNTCFVRNLEGDDLLKKIVQQTFTLSISMKWPLHIQFASWLVLFLLSLGYGINVYPTSTLTPSMTLPEMISSPVFRNSNIIKNVFVPHVSKEKAKGHLTHPNQFQILSRATNIPNTSQNVDELETQQQHAQQQDNTVPLQPKMVADNVPNAMFDGNTFVNPFATPSTSVAESSSSQYVDPSNMLTFNQPYPHEYQWTKDHPLKQVIGEPL
uniref:Integrase, catalytic region, zinc finger, CCHC-type, peptidase aspartic, catalytic n=1 Tax=Tanacetum cinerariifolium TaxID=118510 RepID=A0A6L2KI48_TANCI|nr:integrase, catalytic region, zinc finger, CCHC-type, peptidase aspartic, catalytic [Tanacetum cinerariifolium]